MRFQRVGGAHAHQRIELSFNPFVGKFMFISWSSLCKGDNEFIVEVVKIFFDLTLNFEHDFINVDLGGFFPPRELLFSPVNFGLALTSQGYPRITFCVPNAVTKNCVSFCLPLTSRLAVTYSLIEPSWFLVPSTFITAISFHKLRMRRLCSFAKTRSIKIPVAPESTRAMVSTFRPFICRVTGRCIVFQLYHTYEVLTIGVITAEMLSSSVKNPHQSL